MGKTDGLNRYLRIAPTSIATYSATHQCHESGGHVAASRLDFSETYTDIGKNPPSNLFSLPTPTGPASPFYL